MARWMRFLAAVWFLVPQLAIANLALAAGAPKAVAALQARPPLQILDAAVCPQTPGSTYCATATAFYVRLGHRRVVLLPYHAFAAVGAETQAAVLLVGNDGRWFSSGARVVAADPTDDLVALEPPGFLRGVTPLQLARKVTVGETLAGISSGYGVRGAFAGQVNYAGPVRESDGPGEAPWSLTFQGNLATIAWGKVVPGDSGTPLLDPHGRVAGETVAAASSSFALVPASTLRTFLAGLPDRTP